MAEITIEDPLEVRTTTVDDRGRAVVGKEHEGKRVRVVVEDISDE